MAYCNPGIHLRPPVWRSSFFAAYGQPVACRSRSFCAAAADPFFAAAPSNNCPCSQFLGTPSPLTYRSDSRSRAVMFCLRTAFHNQVAAVAASREPAPPASRRWACFSSGAPPSRLGSPTAAAAASGGAVLTGTGKAAGAGEAGWARLCGPVRGDCGGSEADRDAGKLELVD